MTTCTFQNISKPIDTSRTTQALKGAKPFSYCLVCVEKGKFWDLFYVTESGEISYHKIRCYKIWKLKIYKNAGQYLSRTIEGLMAHLIGRPLSSCFQV
mgnify:FL=1